MFVCVVVDECVFPHWQEVFYLQNIRELDIVGNELVSRRAHSCRECLHALMCAWFCVSLSVCVAVWLCACAGGDPFGGVLVL